MAWLDVLSPSTKSCPTCPTLKIEVGRDETIGGVGLSHLSHLSHQEKCVGKNIPLPPVEEVPPKAELPAPHTMPDTPYLKDRVWQEDRTPTTLVDILRAWGLLPRLESATLVLGNLEYMDAPNQEAVQEWLAGRRKNAVVRLLRQEGAA